MTHASKLLKCAAFRWEGVPIREYKTGDGLYRGVTRHTLLGEGTGEEAFNFITRYFVVIRGRGRLVLGDTTHDIAPFDCVFVAPGVAHQFRASGDEPLGFLCTVDRERDRPEVIA